MKKQPRCPEYNAALSRLETDCLNPTIMYGFNGAPFNKIQDSIRAIIADMLSIFEAKDTDYASNGKPMGNLRSSEQLGVPAWKGTLLRMGDKKQRICSFASRGEFQVKDEQIADTLKDLANYACLASVLFDEKFPNQAFGRGYEPEKVMNHFHMLAVRAIHCKALSEASEQYSNVTSWRAEPLTDLLFHFDEIAAFARKN
mgnify:CR=1 FL=1